MTPLPRRRTARRREPGEVAERLAPSSRLAGEGAANVQLRAYRSGRVGRARPREGRRVRARLLSAGIRDLRSHRDARLYGVLGDAVALSALVLRQGLRKAEDALRSRRQ